MHLKYNKPKSHRDNVKMKENRCEMYGKSLTVFDVHSLPSQMIYDPQH